MLVLTFAGRPDIGAGVNAYTGTIAVSQSSVCASDLVAISGEGAAPGSQLEISLLGGVRDNGSWYSVERSADLGTVRSDSAGNWSLTTTAPATALETRSNSHPYCTSASANQYDSAAGACPPEYVEVPTAGETWLVSANDSAFDIDYDSGFASLTVLNCSVLPVSLPVTGAPHLHMVLAGLLTAPAGAALLLLSHRFG